MCISLPLQSLIITKINYKATQKLDQNYNIRRDEHTLTVWQNFLKAWDLYIGSILNFSFFLCIYSVLLYRVDLSEWIDPRYRFVIPSLIMNIGDGIGRFIYSKFDLNNHKLGMFLVIFQFIGIWMVYILTGNPEMPYSISSKMIILFTVFIYHGYLANMYIDLGQKLYKNSPYDVILFGEMRQYCIQIGLASGAIISTLII